MADRVLKVMVSSTFRDLKAEREAARDAILGQGMLPLMMETDSAIPDRGLLTNSFKMVDNADIYVVLVSNYRYGQIIPDPDLNPKNLSITELEFERAASRNLQICAYLMDETVPPPSAAAVFAEAAAKAQLDTFRARAQHPGRIATTFINLHDLKQKITQTLAHLQLGHISYPAPPPNTANIPQPDRCFGRTDETTRIVAALTAGTHPTAVLIQGPGGIGKTTLTQEAANHPQVVARFNHRRWFAALETATDRDTFDAQILLALGLDATTGFAAATYRLAQSPSLLVLDNLETPWEAAGPAIEARLATLSTIQGLALLVSFRGQEAIGGARWTLRHRLQPLPPPEARALFLDIAETIKQDDPNLPPLLEALGDVPLAICLTARRAYGHPDLTGVWAEWQRTGSELATWQGAGSGRLTSVPHSIALSLGSIRMNQDAHRLFALLGQCPAGLAPDDRTALLGDACFAAESALVAVGLAFHRGPRLDLLPPVRDYARRNATPNEADATAWCRHFLDRAQTQGGRIYQDGGAEALADLAPEAANIDAALRSAPSLSLRDTAVATLNGLGRLLNASGLGSVLAIKALAEACRSATDKGGEAHCYYIEGYVSAGRSDHASAVAAHTRASQLFHDLGDIQMEAYCFEGLGNIALAHSEHGAARVQYEEALPLFRQVGAVLGEANCIRSLGDIALARSDYETARARCEEALPLYRRVDEVVGATNCIYGLGDIALTRSDHDTAQARFEEALLLYRGVGAPLGEANCIRSLGNIALARSEHGPARERYEEALLLYRQVGDERGEANCIRRLGDVALAHPDHNTARARYEEATLLYRRVGDVRGEANCIRNLGDTALARSDHETARARYEEALPLYRRVGDVVGEAGCLLGQGDLSRKMNLDTNSQQKYREAVTLYERVHRLDGVALAHERLASVTTGTERTGHAKAAQEAWLAMNLPEQAERVAREFP